MVALTEHMGGRQPVGGELGPELGEEAEANPRARVIGGQGELYSKEQKTQEARPALHPSLPQYLLISSVCCGGTLCTVHPCSREEGCHGACF